MPDGVLVLGGEDVVVTAFLDEPLVPADAAQPHRIGAVRPQLMVAGNPDHPPEPGTQDAERTDHVGKDLTDVTGHDQPVVVIGGPNVVDDVAVFCVRDVQVADC